MLFYIYKSHISSLQKLTKLLLDNDNNKPFKFSHYFLSLSSAYKNTYQLGLKHKEYIFFHNNSISNILVLYFEYFSRGIYDRSIIRKNPCFRRV